MKRIIFSLITAMFLVAGCGEDVAVVSVSLNKTTLALVEEQFEKLTATVAPDNATNPAVTWTSSTPAVATVANDGTVTAVSVGTATITVTTTDGSKTATCTVTVSAKLHAVTGVSLSESTHTLEVGEEFTLVPTITPDNASNKSVSWASDKPEIATVDANGKVTAVAPGTAVITVTTQDGAKTATCTVTVSDIHVTGVTVDPTELALGVDGMATLTATITPSNATNQKVTWESSDETIAVVMVDENGVVTVAAIAPGTAVITVTTEDDAKTATCTVTVTATILVEEIVLPATVSVGVGKTAPITATVTPENAADKSLTWTSSDPTVATVNADGVVTGVALGEATITATANDGSGVSAEVKVVVEMQRMDFDRTGWSITTEQHNGVPSFTETVSGVLMGLPEQILEGGNTYLAFLKPFRTAGGQSANETGNFPFFVVDMKEAKAFNYFRWRHREGNNQMVLRVWAVHLYGSNDGTAFTQIKPDEPGAPAHPDLFWIPITGGYSGVEGQTCNVYHTIDIPKSTWRYVKVEWVVYSNLYRTTANPQHPTLPVFQHPSFEGDGRNTWGNTLQASEFNLGLAE